MTHPNHPLQRVKEKLHNQLPEKHLEKISKRWIRLGHVLLIKIPQELEKHEKIIAKAFAETIPGVRTVAKPIKPVEGVSRTPNIHIIYGDKKTEVTHKENRCYYIFDVSKQLFCPGNISERIRMAKTAMKNETVVDLFAGIGQFTIPIAVHTGAAKVYACEINPQTYKYLRQNCKKNRVEKIVQPRLGHCVSVAPRRVADRVVMGLVKHTHLYLPLALETLKESGGIIHYHETVPLHLINTRPFERVEKTAEKYGYKVSFLGITKVKRYAPGVEHIVLDAKLG
ncbi:MAG: class I SAM-dependent methyltransferase family protein [Methanobacteriota archaeon]|nr:MAG: class I SAM-dependent methyltransferase family protein [Euryarchaeota archaeon]